MKTIGPYRIVRKLGEGLYTEVFEAMGPQGTVALKIASATADREENFYIREEFRSLSNINHPNVVSVYDFAVAEGDRPFFTMELIKGRHFHQAFRGPSRPFFTALSQILRALHHIHYLGYVHGDIKPENILVTRRAKTIAAKLTDFGMVQNVGVTAPAIPRGTPGYMAPEVFTGMTPDARSDLYSLGVVVYETLAGRSVFHTKESHALLKDRLTVELPPISRWIKDAPAPLERILERMTRIKPENRPRDALEILDALGELLPEDTFTRIEKGQRPLLSSSLVGRRKELEHLLARIRKASGSNNAAVLIMGPPGIGKSRLLKEIKTRAQLERMQVYVVSCIKSDTQPLGPFSELALRGHPELKMDDVALPERSMSGQERAITQFELISKHLSRVSEELGRRQLILFDDLELGSRNLQSLFQYLCKYCRTKHGLACVATTQENIWKDSDGEEFEFEPLALHPLSKAATRRLISNMLGLPAPLDLARWVHDYSGGIPLLAEETISWFYRNSLVTAGNRCEVKWKEIRRKKAPKTIGALTGLLVKGLRREELEMLSKASVIGDMFDEGVLVTISGHSQKYISSILRTLQSRNLIQKEAGTNYSFTHKWVSATLYSKIGKGQKKEMHRKVLNALESAHTGSNYQLARHAEGANLNTKTIRYSLAAAREAREACSFDSSVDLFKLALSRLEERDPRRVQVTEELADAQVWNGDHRAAISSYVSLSSTVKDSEWRARVLRKAALSHYYLDETNASVSLLEKARALIEDSRSKEEVRVLLLSGWTEKKRGNYEQAQTYVNGALNLASRQRDHDLTSRIYRALGEIELEVGRTSTARKFSLEAISAAGLRGNQVSIAEGLHLLASSEMNAGQLTEAASHFNEALDLDKTENYLSGQGSCLVNLALVEQRLGELDKARKHQEEALGIFLKLQDHSLAAAAENNLGYLYDVTGIWEKALKHYGSALRRYKKLGQEKWIAVCHLNIGLLQSLRGDGEGVLNIRRALKSSESTGYWSAAIEAYEALSVALVSQGKVKGALEDIREAERIAKQNGLSTASALLQESEIHLALNDRSSAIETYEEADSIPDSNPYIGARKLRLKAQLFSENANESITNSISILEKLGDRFELAKTLLVQASLFAHGKLTTSEGRLIDAAVVTAEDALDIFRSLGAEPYASISTRQIAEYKKKSRETTDTENTYLRTIFAVNKMVDLLTDQENMLDHVLDRVIDILGAERGMVLLLDEEGDLIPAAGRKIDKQSERDITQISRTVVRNVATTRRPATSANASNDPHYMTLPSITLHGIKSLMCVPLTNRGEAIGALYVDHTVVRNLFAPYDDEFLMTVGNLLAASIDKSRYIDRLETQNVELKRLLHQTFSSRSIIGTSPEISTVRRLVNRFAPKDQNVLITGERGTGKGLIARALHFESARKQRPFVTLDSAHIPAQLIEDTLFGHVKGAFSGAYADSQGLIESANGGTLFLDNVDSIPLDTQAKLVRPLQSGAVRRLGSTRTKSVHFRIISATSIPLEDLVEKGQFRLDLYLTLKILEITVPSLKKRGTDIHELASYFLDEFAARARKRIQGFSNEALDALSAHSWPGNVTELEKCIERAVALCRGELISAREIGLTIPKVSQARPTLESSRGFAELSELSSAMLQSGGNVTRAAQSLGISRRHVQRLLKKHSLLPGQFKPVSGKKTTYTESTHHRPTPHKTKRRKGLSR